MRASVFGLIKTTGQINSTLRVPYPIKYGCWFHCATPLKYAVIRAISINYVSHQLNHIRLSY
jgi:hypothetical protein